MSMYITILGLACLVGVFVGQVKDEAKRDAHDMVSAWVRAKDWALKSLSKGPVGRTKPGETDLHVYVPKSFIRLTSIPRGQLLHDQLRSTVIRRGNHDSEERICLGSGSVRG